MDKTIVFKPLNKENIEEIVTLQFKDFNERLLEKGISVQATDECVELLAKLSYAPEYGARPVRRKLQDLIEDPIAERILSGEFKAGDTIKIGALKGKDEFTFMRVELKVKKEAPRKKLVNV